MWVEVIETVSRVGLFDSSAPPKVEGVPFASRSPAFMQFQHLPSRKQELPLLYLLMFSGTELPVTSAAPSSRKKHPVEKLAPTQTNESASPESLLKRAGFVQALFRLRLTHLVSH